MIGRPLRLLLLEDSADDAELVLNELRRAGFDPTWHRVEDEMGFRAHLDPELDLVLADYHQPQFDALRALKVLQQSGLDLPVVIVSGAIGEDRAVRVAHAILRVERPFLADGHAVDLLACIGIAACPDHGANAETLLQRAEVAMYAAKRSGNSYAVYRKEDDPYDPGRLVLRGDLRRAIDQGEITLFYQPQVAVGTGQAIGVEALSMNVRSSSTVIGL